MLVMTLQAVPTALRGELTRWLLEVQVGVFVGRVSPTVRDKLWEKACASAEAGRVTQAWSSSASEQGFAFRLHGDDRRMTADFDGLLLVAERTAAWEAMRSRLGPAGKTGGDP